MLMLESHTMPLAQRPCPHCQAVLPDDNAQSSCPACGRNLALVSAPKRGAGEKLRPWLLGLAAVAATAVAVWTLYRNLTHSGEPQMVGDSGPPIPPTDWSPMASHVQLYRRPAG